jgi:hypothetical protein
MTQVGQLIMLKTVPFYSIIRSFELREEYAKLSTKYLIPSKRRELTLDTAEWIVREGFKHINNTKNLTSLVRCCKEYICIAKQ